MSNERLGIVEEARQRLETYGRFAYRAPVPGLAKVHAIVVDLKAGTRKVDLVETVAPEKPAAPKPKLVTTEQELEFLRVRLSERERELHELRMPSILTDVHLQDLRVALLEIPDLVQLTIRGAKHPIEHPSAHIRFV